VSDKKAPAAGEEHQQEPKLPRLEVRFGRDERGRNEDGEPQSFVRIGGVNVPVVHAHVDYDFGISSRPPRLRMEVMDHDYKFHAISGYLIDEQTAYAMDALFAVFYAAAGVVREIEAKKGSKAESVLQELRTAVGAFRNTGLAQSPGLDDLKRLEDPRGSAAWPDAEEDDE
jgi:hypothetical protein